MDLICYLCLPLPYCHVCFLQPCGHLFKKRWPLGSLVCDVFLCFCHFLIWCFGSGGVRDCIDSWSLPSFLLCYRTESYILTFFILEISHLS